MAYQIIYLNGPSSSGKTQLAKALQGFLKEPFLHIGIDKIIGLMPEKLNNWEGGMAPQGFSWKTSTDKEGVLIRELKMGPFAKRISNTYKEVVVTLARLGHHLIIDDVAFGKEEVDKWRKCLVEYEVMFIGVHAPLDIIEAREKSRGNRILGSARAQYYKVHEGVDYDVLIDTAKDTLDDNIKRIIGFYAKI